VTAKEYLSQAFKIDLEIKHKLDHMKSLRSLAEQAVSVLSPTSCCGTRNIHRMEDAVTKLLEMETDINDTINKLIKTKQEIMATINQSTSPEYRTLVELRYIVGKSWEDISAELDLSERTVHNRHSNALLETNKILT
jgi:DNA-directed RNA polymerase specialized sigma24 family protein